jgi:hypothetical protein
MSERHRFLIAGYIRRRRMCPVNVILLLSDVWGTKTSINMPTQLCVIFNRCLSDIKKRRTSQPGTCSACTRLRKIDVLTDIWVTSLHLTDEPFLWCPYRAQGGGRGFGNLWLLGLRRPCHRLLYNAPTGLLAATPLYLHQIPNAETWIKTGYNASLRRTEFSLRRTKKIFHWSRRLIATNGNFAAPNRIFAVKLAANHRMVEQKNFIPRDELPYGSWRNFCTME